jgi:hypothetical protein
MYNSPSAVAYTLISSLARRYLVGESDEESVWITGHASTRSSNTILAGDNMASLYQQWNPSERGGDFMRSLALVRRKIKVIIVRLRQRRTIDAGST